MQEDGPATKTFDASRNIWTSFPLASLTTAEYKNKYYDPIVKDKNGVIDKEQTGKNLAKIYGPRPTLEEAITLIEKEVSKDGHYIDPVFDKKQSRIWTSDLEKDSKDSVEPEKAAWSIHFHSGGYSMPFS